MGNITELTKVKKLMKNQRTYANGEGSTKRAIRRGLEVAFGSSNGGGLSSSPSSRLTSVMLMFPFATKVLHRCIDVPLDGEKRTCLRVRVMRFALEGGWRLSSLKEAEQYEEEEEKEGEEEGVLAMVEKEGWFIKKQEAMTVKWRRKNEEAIRLIGVGCDGAMDQKESKLGGTNRFGYSTDWTICAGNSGKVLWVYAPVTLLRVGNPGKRLWIYTVTTCSGPSPPFTFLTRCFILAPTLSHTPSIVPPFCPQTVLFNCTNLSKLFLNFFKIPFKKLFLWFTLYIKKY